MFTKLIPTALAAAVVAGGAWWYSNGATPIGQTALTSAPGFGAAQAQEAGKPDLPLVREMTLGQPDAPVQVIEYASFTCPHCASFHVNAWDQLKANYIATGKISFTMREVYFDRFGLWAGMVARCGGSEQRYFGIVDVLFETQRDWTGPSEPAGIVENLRGIGRRAGLSNADLDTCLNDADKAQAMVATYKKNATADDVPGTPTFFINGKKYSNMGYDDFARTLDGYLSD